MLSPEFIAVITSFLTATVLSIRQRQFIQQSSIDITCTAERSLHTTIAKVCVGVRTVGTTALEVQTAIGASTAKLLAYIRARDGAQLQTSGVSLWSPEAEGQFAGSDSVTFEVPVENMGTFLDGCFENGASDITRITFRASDDVIATAREHAVNDAMKNARADAEIVAKAMNKKLGRITWVNIEDSFTPGKIPPKPTPPREDAVREQIVSATVNVTFAIK